MELERRILAYVLTVCILVSVAWGLVTQQDIPTNLMTVILGALSLAFGAGILGRKRD